MSSSSSSLQRLFSPLTRRVFSEWSHTLSFTSPEADFCAPAPQPVQLPQSFRDALTTQNAAVVVTTAKPPFAIVHVNEAWQDLCGYTKQEVLFDTLKVIQGPNSNRHVANRMVQRLLKTQQEQDAYLLNYTKDGQSFINHLRAGVLKLDPKDEKPELLVGILEKVEPSQVPLRMVV